MSPEWMPADVTVRWVVVWGSLLISAAVAGWTNRHRVLSLSLSLLRWIMLALLFGAALPHVARVCAALLGPTLRALAVDREFLAVVLDKVADYLMGQAVTYADMGDYTAEEQQDLVEGIGDALFAVLGEKEIPVERADVGRLLDEIVKRAFV